MKKEFKLIEENKNSDRLVEAIKHEIKKYFKRERKKKLPDNTAYWDFDCRVGQTEESAENVVSSMVSKAVDSGKEAGWESCYIEILSKPAS
jgi:hypothetical protein